MSERYYIRFRGRVLGPFSSEKTAEMVRRGQVTRVHELSPDGLSWKKAEEFNEFFGKSNTVRSAATQSSRRDDAEETRVETPAHEPKWHVHCEDKEHGPIDESVLIDWIRLGRVRGDNLVWRAGMSDWQPAETVQPNWFPKHVVSSAVRSQQNATYNDSANGGELDGLLLSEITGKTPWIYFISVSIIILGVLSCIGAGIWFLQGVAILRESRYLGTSKLILGGMTGIQAMLTLVCGVLLLRHANALSMLRAVPTTSNAVIAAKRLSAFWFVAGMYMILLLGFLSFGFLVEMLTEAST